jgi:hypothetical protein
MFGTHPSRGVTGDGLPKGQALSVIRDLTLAYALSLLVAVLMAVLSVAVLVFGSRGLYGVDVKIAAGVVPRLLRARRCCRSFCRCNACSFVA